LITDAAPGLFDNALDDIVALHDIVLIPVLPSDIDIRASARFIGKLLLSQPMRKNRRPIAVVANRVRSNTKAWDRLERFLLSLNIPFLAKLRDTQHYVQAYSDGKGIIDYLLKSHVDDQKDWNILLKWLNAQSNKSIKTNLDI
jgi:chromosome partitioning protein